MNTPWSEGIGNRGPLLPYGGGQKEWEYQACHADASVNLHANCADRVYDGAIANENSRI